MKLIGQGSSRKVYSIGFGKVIKFPYRQSGYIQTEKEREIYAQIPSEFKRFFPKPLFLGGGRIIEKKVHSVMDLFPHLEGEIGYVDVIQFLREEGVIGHKEEYLYDKLEEILAQHDLFIEEIRGNASNLGVKRGKLYILDWGYRNNQLDW